MRIGILLTSDDTSAFALRYPNDGIKFRNLLSPHRPDWTFEVIDATRGELPDDVHEYDGYVITGSPSSVNDGHGWIDRLLAFIREMHWHRQPVVGCCFGHQAIARAIGGRVGLNREGWSVGIAETEFTKVPEWSAGAGDTIRLHAAHHEQIIELPDEMVNIGSTPGCLHAACIVGDHMFTTQYHPEMGGEFMRDLVDEMADELGEEGVAKALEALEGSEQGEEFGGWMVRFIEQATRNRA